MSKGLKSLVVSAPGKAILTGPHAVLYQTSSGEYAQGVTASIGMRTYVSASRQRRRTVKIHSANLDSVKEFDEKNLRELSTGIDGLIDTYKQWNGGNGNGGSFNNSLAAELQNFIFNSNQKQPLLGALYIVGEIMREYDTFIPLNIKTRSLVPKNFGTSASAYVALAGSVLSFCEGDPFKVDYKKIGEIAHRAETIPHAFNSSGIDPWTCLVGGYNTYSKNQGIKPIEIEDPFDPQFLLIYSGEPPHTSEMTAHVRKRYEESPKTVQPIIDRMDEISHGCAKALLNLTVQNKEKKSTFAPIGKYMKENGYCLKELGVTTEPIDKITNFVEKEGGWATPTGGCGGGYVLAFSGSQTCLRRMKRKAKNKGWPCYITRVGGDGLKIEKIERF